MDDDYLVGCKLRDTDLSFSGALLKAKMGDKIARSGWNGKNVWVRLLTDEEVAGSVLSQECLVIEYPKGHPAYPNGSCIPWFASASDVLAKDWMIV